ncbi:hypothetical protein BDZ94DRAFT_600816 [Collybia nuda]|uniref:G-protein coupled receptors family 1 profile domain-containing protein n=1 Tax=Collybia nuda TaxID=64659 RepID=A0A9P5Y7B8_9AGAR|nr:hypothetical protein BDZ94DRAFT_600816 [Collybia nuda]
MSTIPSRRVESGHIIIFDALAFLGCFLTVAVLVPALLSPRIKRSETWFGLLMSWLLYSVSYILLIGRQVGPKPSLGLCMFQSALVYATSPLCAAATMCFAFDCFLKLSKISPNGRTIGRKTAKMLVIFPWVLALVIAGEAILSVNDSSKVRRNASHFYCHITSRVPSLVNAIIVVLCILVIIPLEIYTGFLLYRNWTLFKRLSITRARIALSTLTRLALFSFIISLALFLTILSATRIDHPRLGPAWYMILISLPSFSALCFGIQKDILEAWLFWRKKESDPASSTETAEV